MGDVVSAVQLLKIPMLVPEETLGAEDAVLGAQCHIGAEEGPAISALELVAVERDAPLTQLFLPVGVPARAPGALVAHDPVEAHSVAELGLSRWHNIYCGTLGAAARHKLWAGLELWTGFELWQQVFLPRGCIDGWEFLGLWIESHFLLGHPWVVLRISNCHM